MVLNQAPATLAYAVLDEGRPIVVKDAALYWRFFLTISSAAEDFREFAPEYHAIKRRSRSLSEIERDRLLRIVDFLRDELADADSFQGLTQKTYLAEADTRRNLERWIENIVNASIDIAKLLLASTRARIPRTYRQVLSDVMALPGFDPKIAERLAGFARLRTILAYEYLDIRWSRIAAFLREAVPHYGYPADHTGKLLSEVEETS